MRLITHNMLKCNIRGVIEGYPLIIEHETIQIDETYNNGVVVIIYINYK